MSLPSGIRQIGELSKDGVFAYDLSARRFEYVNPAMSAFLDTVGKWAETPNLLLPLIHLEDKDYVRHRFDELIANAAIHDTEFRLEFSSGRLVHISCDAYVTEKTLVIGFIKDVSQIKEHEDYIIGYGAKKDTLLDMLSHNLSGPLLLTQNILQWIRNQYEKQKTSDITEQLTMIQDNTQNCLEIINDFLREEHIESQRIYVKKTRFDLLEKINATLEKIIVTNRDKKFTLITGLDSVNITTDSVKFFQIIHNLISNSIKFTPAGGKIDIIVEETTNSYLIRVADNGIGIPQTLQNAIFVKKTPASRRGLNNEESQGMGLSIVKSLTELIGGSVSFTSVENQGSVFTVELPKE